jgi:nucleoprotein TPR
MISKLEQELKNANELISIAKRKGATVLSESDIEQLSPAAAIASRLLKSGMTLTQVTYFLHRKKINLIKYIIKIYSEYVNLSDKLQGARAENEELKAYIHQIVNEIEEKAPLLNNQKQEYEEALNTINNLTNQLEKSMIVNKFKTIFLINLVIYYLEL